MASTLRRWWQNCRKLDVRFSITIRQQTSHARLFEAIPEEEWTPIDYWQPGGADVAETTCSPFQDSPDAAPVRAPDSAPRLFVFDPRYKLDSEDRDGEEGLTERPKKSDIDKMHAYRDAIREEDGERVIEYAAILYPGLGRHFGDDVAALEALAGRETELQVELDSVLSGALKTTTR